MADEPRRCCSVLSLIDTDMALCTYFEIIIQHSTAQQESKAGTSIQVITLSRPSTDNHHSQSSRHTTKHSPPPPSSYPPWMNSLNLENKRPQLIARNLFTGIHHRQAANPFLQQPAHPSSPTQLTSPEHLASRHQARAFPLTMQVSCRQTGP